MHLGCLTVLWAVSAMDNDVRSLREARGLTQAQLGAALGVSRQSVNSIEKGKYDPSLPLAIAIARYFETTVEEIFHV
ncbi:hypothetical protein HMPREF0975_02548 [Actinomyces sp. oral taxon 849 str. F0330]|uniref:DNA-binding helix-turn-helix protein n=3 Tax=Actinomycetaceae TaxID=2049 RepID=U1S3J7_9ACTO|nr:hypothetical protein HMPREF0975_02548 [Actinomyces sp. oral taxon 849 str. F0330]ERH21718.1 DNA-binding helix-turn-helix protein [Actinomyces johnsonii F0510]ERH25242.1 DNA-binding helix-turn-helix protein [Actinomyces johnsonii F0542]